MDTLLGNLGASTKIIAGELLAMIPVHPAAEVAPSQAELVVPNLPTNALVRSCTVRVTAAPPSGLLYLRSVGELRATGGEPSSDEIVADFQTLRTVSRLRLPAGATLSELHAWVGTQFNPTPITTTPASSHDYTFAEVQTERLLIKLSAPIQMATFEAGAAALFPSPPGDLKLEVNGKVAWSHPGVVRSGQSASGLDGSRLGANLSPPPAVDVLSGRAMNAGGSPAVTSGGSTTSSSSGATSPPGGAPTATAGGVWSASYQTTIDLTLAAAAALAGSPGELRFVLTAKMPGKLAIELVPGQPVLRYVHEVAFPEGRSRTLQRDREGLERVVVPLPSEAHDHWSIEQLSFVVEGRPAAWRAVPASGPAHLPRAGGSAEQWAAELVADPERAFMARLPAKRLLALKELHAVRLPLLAGDDGAEVSGVLCGGTKEAPGAPIADAAFEPITIEPVTLVPGQVLSFQTLSLRRPWKLVPNQPLWLGLHVVRGRVSWPVAVPSSSADDAVVLRRGLPEGPFRPMPAVPGGLRAPGGASVTQLEGILRLVGAAPESAPLPAIERLELRAKGGGVHPNSPLAFSPTAEGVTVLIGFDVARHPPEAPAIELAGNEAKLALDITWATACQLDIRSFRVVYGRG